LRKKNSVLIFGGIDNFYLFAGFEPGAGEVHKLEATRNAELLVDVVDMIPDCVVRDKQFPLDVFVALPLKPGSMVLKSV